MSRRTYTATPRPSTYDQQTHLGIEFGFEVFNLTIDFAMTSVSDITKLDLFEFLGITETATDSEIKKAFRQKALKCHPDKNPDDPNAAEQFQKYGKAAEILLDASARAAYEKVLRARKDHAHRNRHLDSKRKKLRDDLESRERAAKDVSEREEDAGLKLAQEIERLRKEGSKELERQNEELRRQVQEELRASLSKVNVHDVSAKIKIDEDVHRVIAKWKKTPFTEDILRKLFGQFGTITDFIMSRKSAIIEYKNYREANAAKLGAASDVLSVAFIGEPKSSSSNNSSQSSTKFIPNLGASNATYSTNELDYESTVLLKLKRAQEKKRMLEQMEKNLI